MTTKKLTSTDELQQALQSDRASALYFSQPACGVCRVLEPKLEALFSETLPEIPFYTINTVDHPDLAAQNSVFTVPTLLVFFEQSEMIRESRYMSVPDIANRLSRPYELMFG